MSDFKKDLPLDGRSEYLVQNTHAGQSWPFGPLTIPGGTSSSFLPSLLSSPLELLLDELVVLFEDECLDDKSTGWLTIVLLLTLDVADDGEGDDGSFLMLKDEFVCDWIWEAATIFLKFDNELLIKGLDGDDDSDDDFGDNGNPDDGGLLFPKVGLNILSMENGRTLCKGLRKFAWFWSWGGKNGFGEADNVWFLLTFRKGWNSNGKPVVELNVEGELKGEFVVVYAEWGDTAMEDAGEWFDPLDEQVLGVAGGEFTGDP